MTRILSRFHRFLCPPPAGEASGETHFVQQASRYPAYRALAKASAPSDRTAAMRRTAPLSGFPTFCSQPRHRREARLSIHPAPFRRTCPEPMRDVRSSIPGDPPAEQPAPASAPAEGGDAGGIRATCRDAVAFEAEIHLSAAPGLSARPERTPDRDIRGRSLHPAAQHAQAQLPRLPSGVERAAPSHLRPKPPKGLKNAPAVLISVCTGGLFLVRRTMEKARNAVRD